MGGGVLRQNTYALILNAYHLRLTSQHLLGCLMYIRCMKYIELISIQVLLENFRGGVIVNTNFCFYKGGQNVGPNSYVILEHYLSSSLWHEMSQSFLSKYG